MSDEKNTPGGTRPLHDELFAGTPTEPLGAPAAPTEPLPAAAGGPGSPAADETLVLPTEHPTPAGTARTGRPAHHGARGTGGDDARGTDRDDAHPAASAQGGAPDQGVAAPRTRGPRVATIVWGFVVFALGAAVLAGALGADVDLGLAAIVVLVVAGVTLVVGSIVSSARRRGRG